MNGEITSSPESIKLPSRETVEFNFFLQLMTNRLAVGHLRYGRAQRSQHYLTRLKKELKTYIKEGNMEQLINIANYCFLESIAPENGKFHFDPYRKSATRK